MVIVKLQGGIGNQMFQYAAGRSLALRLKTNLMFDCRLFANNPENRKFRLDAFRIRGKIIPPREIRKIELSRRPGTIMAKKPLTMISEKILFKKVDDFFTCRGNVYLNGYFQSPVYFGHIREPLLKDFRPVKTPDVRNAELIARISSVNSVSIHVRRGDYIKNQNTKEFHGICSAAYYQKAIEYFMERIPDPYFFVFSDDISWVKENIVPGKAVFYIEGNGNDETEDLRLMRRCRHHIIANSSFSWWAAWLNTDPDPIVVAPRDWLNKNHTANRDPDFNESYLMPDTWIRIEN